MVIERMLRDLIARQLPSDLNLRRHSLLPSTQPSELEGRLQDAARSFSKGLGAAVECTTVRQLHEYLTNREGLNDWQRGFAFEGAAMGIGILESTLPWKRGVFGEFSSGWGRNYLHLIHVGMGWARGRANAVPDLFPKGLDPLLRWLTVDGYGFYRGLFCWSDDAVVCSLEKFSPSTSKVLCQGYGRALWFLCRGSPATLEEVIAQLPRKLRGEAWSGAGLACVYAGRIEGDELHRLVAAAGGWRPALAQGAAFAAKARKLAGDFERASLGGRNGSECEYYDEACRVLCGMDARAAAAITDDALDGLPPDGEEPAYAVWQRRIRRAFSSQVLPGPVRNAKPRRADALG
jgi:enediyne biosynthesis protein E3